METPKPSDKELQQTKGIDAQLRYNLIVHLGHEHLNGTALVSEKSWEKDDVKKAKEFMLACAPFAHPKILPSYWEHIIIASIYGRKLAEQVNSPDLNPHEAEALLLLNDTGRLVVPNHYLRNDLVGNRLAQQIGIRSEFMQKLPSMFRILGIGPNPFHTLEDVPEVQRITDIADTIGKKVADGQLFDVKSMDTYNQTLVTRYAPTSPWPTENRGRQALVDNSRQEFVFSLVLEEIAWLKNKYNVDINSIREEVKEEFDSPENQAFLLALKDAHETLDSDIDRLLGRGPPLK